MNVLNACPLCPLWTRKGFGPNPGSCQVGTERHPRPARGTLGSVFRGHKLALPCVCGPVQGVQPLCCWRHGRVMETWSESPQPLGEFKCIPSTWEWHLPPRFPGAPASPSPELRSLLRCAPRTQLPAVSFGPLCGPERHHLSHWAVSTQVWVQRSPVGDPHLGDLSFAHEMGICKDLQGLTLWGTEGQLWGGLEGPPLEEAPWGRWSPVPDGDRVPCPAGCHACPPLLYLCRSPASAHLFPTRSHL